MLNGFIHIRLLDVFDIILVAILLYQLYMLIRGTVAYSISLGIAVIYTKLVLVARTIDTGIYCIRVCFAHCQRQWWKR